MSLNDKLLNVKSLRKLAKQFYKADLSDLRVLVEQNPEVINYMKGFVDSYKKEVSVLGFTIVGVVDSFSSLYLTANVYSVPATIGLFFISSLYLKAVYHNRAVKYKKFLLDNSFNDDYE